MTSKTGFITGTGFYTLPGIENTRTQELATPYGPVTVETGVLGGQEMVFIQRHGKTHALSPSQVNYRANVYAMKMLGVQRILATSVCGSLASEWGPGALVLVDQFINFTYKREDTFYPLDGRLKHVAMTDPYCPTLHGMLSASAVRLGLELGQGATYACTEGPRFETRAEIEMIRRLGGHLVGQTNYPECVLARELAICYATVAVVSNYAAGMSSNLTAKEVTDNIRRIGTVISDLFADVVRANPDQPDCACQHALDEAEL
jgi:5'-methylthioadenosine phosphorylase